MIFLSFVTGRVSKEWFGAGCVGFGFEGNHLGCLARNCCGWVGVGN
jgi:hypothetical protein